MDWEAISAIAEILGALGVIVSVIYLAVQVRQSTKWLRTTFEQTISDKLTDLLLAISTSSTDLTTLVFKGQESPSSLSDEELQRYILWVMAGLRLFEQAYHQYTEGNLSSEIWSAHEAQLKSAMQVEVNRRIFESRRLTYHEGFRKFVEQLEVRDAPLDSNEMLAYVRGETGGS